MYIFNTVITVYRLYLHQNRLKHKACEETNEQILNIKIFYNVTNIKCI